MIRARSFDINPIELFSARIGKDSLPADVVQIYVF